MSRYSAEDQLRYAKHLLANLLRRVHQADLTIWNAIHEQDPEDAVDSVNEAITILSEDYDNISREALEAEVLDKDDGRVIRPETEVI